ncbi:MAG: SufE family protein [Litorimonas sp.]
MQSCAYVSFMQDYPDDIQDLIDDFAFLDDWEARYMHVIDMGKSMPPLSSAEKTDIYKVKGCVSQVWLVSEVQDGKLVFRGDSDAHIVKGLVAVVLRIFSNRRPAQIIAIDANDILKALELDEHLSPQRSNGLKAMIERIKNQAQALSQS